MAEEDYLPDPNIEMDKVEQLAKKHGWGLPPPHIPKKDRHLAEWTTKNGITMKVVNMEDRHLYNSYMVSGHPALFEEMMLRMFERNILGFHPPKKVLVPKKNNS